MYVVRKCFRQGDMGGRSGERKIGFKKFVAVELTDGAKGWRAQPRKRDRC